MANLKDLIVTGSTRIIGKLYANLFGQEIVLQKLTSASSAYDSSNPKITFKNGDGAQSIALVYTDYDSVQAPDSVTLVGNQAGSYFIAPYIKATSGFKGSLDGNASTATKLATARTIQTNLGSTSTASFDGSANVSPGVTGTLAIGNGGTGQTTAKGAQYNLLNGMNSVTDAAGDATQIACRYTSPSAANGAIYYRTASNLWNYIKGKADATYQAKGTGGVNVSYNPDTETLIFS